MHEFTGRHPCAVHLRRHTHAYIIFPQDPPLDVLPACAFPLEAHMAVAMSSPPHVSGESSPATSLLPLPYDLKSIVLPTGLVPTLQPLTHGAEIVEGHAIPGAK